MTRIVAWGTNPRCASIQGLAAFFLAVPCAAHDFWLQPDQFWIEPSTIVPITLQVGHDQARQRSPIPLKRIVRFEARDEKGAITDLREALTPGGKMDDGHIQLPNPGTYILALETDSGARSDLPAPRFNAYLKEEGLTTALAQRMQTQRMEMDGSEFYSRNAKALIHVAGKIGSKDQGVSKPVGLPLEIIPLENPYADPSPDTLPVQVTYLGQALPGALVKLTNLDQDSQPFATQVTDGAGRARFLMPHSGHWLLNVIWTKPLPRSLGTDFETVFSSLSFGFR